MSQGFQTAPFLSRTDHCSESYRSLNFAHYIAHKNPNHENYVVIIIKLSLAYPIATWYLDKVGFHGPDNSAS